jgi:DNA invertase Pin-like site-specific DNA recombinase
MKIGYVRVSTHEQNLDLQKDALAKVGCEEIFEDHISGKNLERPGLQQAFEMVRKGDSLIVWRLDRLGRSLKELIELVNQLDKRQIGLLSICESINTTTSSGKLVFHIFGALAEFERNLIIERTKAGLTAARARGRKGGRPKGLSRQAEATACAAETLYLERKLSVNQIAEKLGVSKRTLYNYLKHRKVNIGSVK